MKYLSSFRSIENVNQIKTITIIFTRLFIDLLKTIFSTLINIQVLKY